MKIRFGVIFRLLSVICAFAMFLSCSKDEGGEDLTRSRSVLIYIASQNSLGSESYDKRDISEIMNATRQIGPNNHVILFVDDFSTPRIYELTSSTKVELFSDLKPVYTFSTDVNSASPEVFEEVLSFFFSRYAANDYGLVLWSHGSGWVNSDGQRSPSSLAPKRAFAEDSGSVSPDGRIGRMDISDMAQVMAKFPKFEYILFDACFMQCIEVDYELRDAASYIIGSAAEIPGDGAPYHKIMAPLFQKPFSPKALIDAYAEYYQPYSTGVLLSAVKTDELPQFTTFMSQIFSKYVFSDKDYSSAQRYFMLEWNFRYTSLMKMPFYEFYDMQGIMLNVLSPEDYQEWKSAFSKLVPYSVCSPTWLTSFRSDNVMTLDMKQYGGVSMYVPLEKYKSYTFSEYFYQTQWGKTVTIQ